MISVTLCVNAEPSQDALVDAYCLWRDAVESLENRSIVEE